MDSRRDLKWENQIVDFQKATGEVFSDRLKCAIVLSRSPAPIRTYLRVQNRGDFGALRVALMNYLEAEDDGHGSVPMEVGAMKGKKGDRCKKGYGKGTFGKNLGKYDKSNEHSKRNDYSKGSEKGREKGKKGKCKGKGQGKDEKPAANSSFQGYCRTCGKWGHKASECWQGYVQAVEEALIQEFNVDQGPGWIFSVMGGSVTIGTDNLWDELVLDSGSVSTACPYAWCSDISLNNEDKVHLQDIQQRRIRSHGSRVVLLELWGPEGCVECRVKFDVADVAYPVLSLGKMVESGFTFSFDDYKCYMHKGNRRVEIFRKGRILVLRMRRRWLKDKVQMVAPIEEVVAGEMEIDDDGEGEEDARMEPRADEPGDVPPPPRPREVRPSAMRPGAEIVRLHILTHCPYQSWCEVCVASNGRSDHYHREAPQSIDGVIARIQMDFMFVGAEGTFVDEPRAKATVLMVICKDDGNLCATEVRSKTDEYGVEMVIRFLSTYESVEIKTDGEPSIVEVARRVQARRDKMTTLAQTSVGGHQEIGVVERANGTVQAQLRAYFLDVQNRMQVRIIPGTLLFPWMLRHSVWTVVRYQSDQRTKQTPYERTRGCRCESALVPYGEVVMAKIADADKMRAGKLDSAWVKAVCVGRVGRSNEHLLLTTKGCIRSRVVRRIPDGNQASYHAEVQGLPSDTLKGSAEMLRNALVRPGEPPRPSRGRPRKDGSPAQARTATTSGHATRDDPMPGSSDDHLRQTAMETDVIEQNIVMDSGIARTSENIVMDSGTARTSENIVMDSGNARESDSIVMGSENARASDGRGDQGVLRMDQEEGISAEEQARRRLRSKQPDRRSDDETVSKRMKRETTIVVIKKEILKTVEERHKFYSRIRILRSPESIHASRMVEINKWRERGVIERWSRQAAMATGGQLFNARWVDEQHKEKSRYVVKDFANTRDPTMFAAASDTAVGREVEFKAVLQIYSMFTFDVTSAYTHVREDELLFLEPPLEEIEEHGDCVWRSIRVIYRRRKGARSWQEHFDSIIRGEEARQRGFTVEAHPKCPTLYYVREADGVIELHVDDGHGCGKETVIAELLPFLSEKIEMKWVQGIKCGSVMST